MTTCKRGDVILVIFPHSDLRTYKKRPALVVQADNLDTGIDQRIIAMITSNMQRTGPSRVPVIRASRMGRHMGLLTDSVVVVDNLATVNSMAVDTVIGACPAMERIDAALRVTLGLT